MDARLVEVGRYTSVMYLDSYIIHKAIIKRTLLLKIYAYVSHIAVIVMYGLIWHIVLNYSTGTGKILP